MKNRNTGGKVKTEALMNMRDAHQMLATVGLILVVAFALQLATLPPAGIVIVLVVLAVVLIGLYLHFRAQRKTSAAPLAPQVREVTSPDGEPVRVLESGGVYQSATYLDDRRFEPVFAYQRAFEVMFEVEQEMRAAHGHGIERALAIGGGGFAWPKYALTRHPELILDVVESDPSIIELARRWFFVDELKGQVGDRLYIMEADGRELIDELAPGMEFAATPTAVHCRAPYDAVVNDTFSGAEPVRALATVEAARSVRAVLRPAGLYLTNVVSREEGRDLAFLRDEVATLAEVFAHVHVVPATDELWGGEDNYLLIATDGAYTFSDAIPFDEDFLGTPLRD